MAEKVIRQEIQEFLCLNDSVETFFTRERTLQLIELYKKYKPMVGTGQIKTLKKLWEIIATDLSNLFRITISATKCENKWKVLERSYKKVVDNNNNQTGRGRKIFQFETEFDEIFGKKCNIRPEILLSSDKVIKPCIGKSGNENRTDDVDDNLIGKKTNTEQDIIMEENQDQENTPNIGNRQGRPTLQTIKRKRSYRTETRTYRKRNEILLELKDDLKMYYHEKTRIDKEKLALQQKKVDDQIKRTSLLEEYVQMVKEQGIEGS